LLAWYPALRWHEHYPGLLEEQGNLKENVKGKGRKPELASLKYRRFFQGRMKL
jgi:hypothetical protein